MNRCVSVVVPVWGAERTLDRCVRSVLGQALGPGDALECILVDDGSPDRCGEICDAYAAAAGPMLSFLTATMRFAPAPWPPRWPPRPPHPATLCCGITPTTPTTPRPPGKTPNLPAKAHWQGFGLTV